MSLYTSKLPIMNDPIFSGIDFFRIYTHKEYLTFLSALGSDFIVYDNYRRAQSFPYSIAKPTKIDGTLFQVYPCFKHWPEYKEDDLFVKMLGVKTDEVDLVEQVTGGNTVKHKGFELLLATQRYICLEKDLELAL